MYYGNKLGQNKSHCFREMKYMSYNLSRCLEAYVTMSTELSATEI